MFINSCCNIWIARLIRTKTITNFTIAHKFQSAQLSSTQSFKNVNHSITVKPKFKCDFSYFKWNPIIELFLMNIIFIKWWWNHQINFRLRLHTHKRFSHLKIILMKLGGIPFVVFEIVSSKHHNDNISFWVQSILVILFIPIWNISCFQRCSISQS